MVKFLIQRPIAVIMTFLALVIAGSVMFFALPVSLLPDIDIPRITVKINADNLSARELENTVTAPVRRQLMQVNGIEEIRSETFDGSVVIAMDMRYGINTDLAFIEANEKIDAAMSYIPRDIARPKVIKSNVTNIPVTYLYLTLKENAPATTPDEKSFYNLGEIAQNIVRRRLEQLPQIAMVDMTGVAQHYLRVTPRQNVMESLSITVDDIENALRASNITPGNMTVRDGYYRYSVSMPNALTSAEDVADVFLRKGERIFRLKEFCDISLEPRATGGYATFNGKRAVVLAIIKHNAETMADYKAALASAMQFFSDTYPYIEFTAARNQTDLLDYSISNLQMNLVIGLLLVFGACAMFLADYLSPIVVAVSIIVAIILTFLIFYLTGTTVNIISLAGLILAVGMMIDNSVIVTENISQYRQRGLPVDESCIYGTNEIITPMLSSSLTTIAVFFPLVFMSGIAGAIFTDQAISIAAGLAASYIVGILLLPVLYRLMARSGWLAKSRGRNGNGDTPASRWLSRRYDRGMKWVFSHKTLCGVMVILSVPAAILAAKMIPHRGMPEIDGTERICRIDWNENIDLTESNRRMDSLYTAMKPFALMQAAYIGPTDYMLDTEVILSGTETEIYLNTGSKEELDKAERQLSEALKGLYPGASAEFSNPGTVFERIFDQSVPALEARIFYRNPPAAGHDNMPAYQSLNRRLSELAGTDLPGIQVRRQIVMTVNKEKMTLYGVTLDQIQKLLSTAFNSNRVTTFQSFQKYLPVEIKANESDIMTILNETLVPVTHPSSKETSHIPLSQFIDISHRPAPKSIVAGKSGEYVPFVLPCSAGHVPALTGNVTKEIGATGNMDVEFHGSYFSNERMLKELLIILGVSVLLIYFILCAQFESFMQPLIVLLEIPFDAAFAIIALWIAGDSLNVMSAIGIVVTSGIVVNDSILKLDAINELRKQGMPLMEAIHTAGHKRLRAIVMTSLTTVAAMVPVLFSSDIGSQLQRPLAIAVISSMVVGTIVSIFIIPLVYWLIYRKNDTTPSRAYAG